MVSIHSTVIQTVFLWQGLAASLPAPRGTLAGGGSPRMSDDVGLLQAVAEGSHNEILQAPSVKNTDIQKVGNPPAKQPRQGQGLI